MKDYKIAALKEILERNSKKLSRTSNLKYKLLFINNKPIYAKLANTNQELAEGLMFVESLEEDQGCLLEFPYEQQANIWMKNCRMDLAAAMIDQDGVIVKIARMSHRDPYYIHNSPKPVKYVLEMNLDFFDKNNINLGDRVKIPSY